MEARIMKRTHYFFLGIALAFLGFFLSIIILIDALLFDNSSVEQMISILILPTILIIIGLICLQLSKSSRIERISPVQLIVISLEDFSCAKGDNYVSSR